MDTLKHVPYRTSVKNKSARPRGHKTRPGDLALGQLELLASLGARLGPAILVILLVFPVVGTLVRTS